MAHIGVDLDGVLYDFGEDARIVVAEHLNIQHTLLPAPKVWDFWSEQWGIDNTTFWKLWFEDMNRGGAWCRLAPVGGTVEGLTALRDAGHLVHIVTSRKDGEVSTVKWIRDHGIPYDMLHIGPHKAMVNVDLLVDDWERNWQDVTDVGGRCLIWNQPWNTHVEDAERVFSWDDVLKVV